MEKITLSADVNLIEIARACAEQSTLNELFRLWLEGYVRSKQAEDAIAFIHELRGKLPTGGRKFTRDEMNER